MNGYQRGPLILQSTGTLLLSVHHPDAQEAQRAVAPFTVLVQDMPDVRIHRVDRITLLEAALMGLTPEDILHRLTTWSGGPVPLELGHLVTTQMSRAGLLELRPNAADSVQLLGDSKLLRELERAGAFKDCKPLTRGPTGFVFAKDHRGAVKLGTARAGYYIRDLIGTGQGVPLCVALRTHDADGTPMGLRPYQEEAVQAFLRTPDGCGVIVLPCGAGKTYVGLATISALQTRTLVITQSQSSAEQWRGEALRRLTLGESDVTLYTSRSRRIAPITITTYTMLSARRQGIFTHYEALERGGWGLIIYDEVQCVPASMFRLAAAVQSTKRLGLTATLVREDGRETDVFSLIGPRCHEVGWRDVEQDGYLAPVTCVEVGVEMADENKQAYASAPPREKQRIAAENPAKLQALKRLLDRHRGESTLVIGEYLSQLREIARHINAPLVSGQLGESERQKLYDAFRRGDQPVLVVSRVANLAIDLPQASCGIEVSGVYGSRQEEAQRVGRLLRPKRDGSDAHFYAIVSRRTVEHERARHRQQFLVEQGYRYLIEREDSPCD